LKKYLFSMVCILIAVTLCPSGCLAAPPLGPDSVVIVIDPGHGGTSRGAETPSGIMEKDVALLLSQTLMSILKERYAVILTRTDDSAVPIDERTAIANRNRADLFISIHAKPGTTGDTIPSVFYHQPGGDPGRGFQEGSWEASQLPHVPRSRIAAEAICKALSPRTRSGDCALGAPIAVLAGAAMPAILVEPFSLGGFPDIRAAIAELLQRHALDLARGIDAFFGREAPGP